MIRRLLFLGLPLVAAIVAAAAGWWLFVREDNELAEAAPEIPQDLRTQTASPASTPPAGSESDGGQAFTILADRSEAAYFAGEKLARLSVPSTAKGATRQISGKFHLTPTGLDSAHESKFVVDLRSLKSDETMRDRRVQTALETSRFPEATFLAKSISGPIESINATSDTELTLTGMLTIRSVQREVTWDVKTKRDGNVLTALATVNFRYADFGVPVPNIGGFVSVEEDVTLQVQITAQSP